MPIVSAMNVKARKGAYDRKNFLRRRARYLDPDLLKANLLRRSRLRARAFARRKHQNISHEENDTAKIKPEVRKQATHAKAAEYYFRWQNFI